MRNRHNLGFSVLSIMLAVATMPLFAADTTDRLATDIRLYVGRQAASSEGKTQLSPGLQIVSPGKHYYAGTEVEQLKGKLKKNFGLSEMTATPMLTEEFYVGKEKELTTQAGSVKFRLTLVTFTKYNATYLVRTFDNDTLLNESKIEIVRGNRGIIGGRDGETAPFFFLVIEPVGVVQKISGKMSAPEIVSRVNPVYPEEMRTARVQGVVIVQAVIDEAGTVVNVSIIESPNPGLNQVVIDAIKQWRYKPALLNGKPVAVYLTITVSFMLRDDDATQAKPKE